MTACTPPEALVNFHPVLGESPVWHPDQQRLYWVDIDHPRIFYYEPATGAAACCYTHPDRQQRLGAMLLQTDGSLLLFMKHGAIGVYRSTQDAPHGAFELLRDHTPGVEGVRFNDAIAAPHGRVYSGTHPGHKNGQGVLYRIDPDLTATPLVRDIEASNGLAFSLDNCRLYFVDSYAHRIYLFDYDEVDGSLHNRRIFYDQTKDADAPEHSHPDGITTDTQGRLWCVFSRAGLVRCFDPEMPQTPGRARTIADFPVPASNATSLTFGGPDLSDLYITSAVKTKPQGDNGALIRMAPAPLHSHGRPEFRANIGA